MISFKKGTLIIVSTVPWKYPQRTWRKKKMIQIGWSQILSVGKVNVLLVEIKGIKKYVFENME